MIIQKVSMRNFVSYQDASVDFPLGVTVIVGQNGAGKTSILDAVTYSLFREHGRGVDANLIRRGQPQSKVAVVFSVRGKNYEVEWSLSPGKPSIGNLRDISSGYPLVKPGSGEKTIIPEIAKLIGVDSKVFMNAIYVRQGQLAQLIEERPAERKKIIGHLLGIDELEKLWEALKDPLSTLRNELTNYEFKLRKADEIKTQLQQKKQELETKKHELSEIESKRREISEQLTGKRRELEMLREKKRIDEELTRNIITISADLQSRKSELKLVSEKITELTKA
ncbi:MAG: SMC family ATPase, partial [Candidatus Caldarchaeum sp.]